MNPNDLPITSIAGASSEELLAAVRRIAQGPLAERVDAIDREGLYPAEPDGRYAWGQEAIAIPAHVQDDD